jgi:hypothetical protein
MTRIRRNIKLIILLSLAFFIIPILISYYTEAFPDEKITLTSINSQNPVESYVYYEDTIGIAHSIYVSGDYAYIGIDTSGLAVIDISNPKDPGTPIYQATNGSAYDVVISGDYAYVSDGPAGLAVIDISDPTSPGMPVFEATIGIAYGIYVSGDYAYLGTGSSGLAIMDISDPTNPGIPIYEDTLGNARGVYVSGDYAYIADMSSGLAIIDISDPTNPGIPVYQSTSGFAYDVFVSGDHAFVGEGSSGLAIINISDPTSPGTPNYIDTTGSAQGVYINGNYAFVADFESGLAGIDISDLTNPSLSFYEDTNGSSYQVYVSGTYAYVADGSSGLAVIEIIYPIYGEIPGGIEIGPYILAAIFGIVAIVLAIVIRRKPKWRTLEDLSFTTGHPKVMKPDTEYSLSVYPHFPEMQKLINQQIENKESEQDFDAYEPTLEPFLELKCAISLKFRPNVKGIEFFPVTQEIAWYRDIKEVNFKLNADSKMVGNVLKGAIDIYKDSVLIGQIPLSIEVSQEEKPTEIAKVRTNLFDSVFVSYSHDDTFIVDHFKEAYKSLGIEVKIDKDILRAGDKWNEKLIDSIDESDVFQLYWSTKAKDSKYVTEEWEHALKISDKKEERFIRPCYWEDPLPTPPEELSNIHFQRVNINIFKYSKEFKKRLKAKTKKR